MGRVGTVARRNVGVLFRTPRRNVGVLFRTPRRNVGVLLRTPRRNVGVLFRTLLPSVGVLLLALAGCTASWKQAPHDTRFQRAPAPALHAKPAGGSPLQWWDATTNAAVLPLAKVLSPARYVGWLLGGRDALDVNAHGEVPDSTWFENRLGRREMTPEEVGRGAAVDPGPADGPLLVLGDKTEGVTPGLIVRDTHGIDWYVKFDPPAFPELTTAAELIGSRLLHAAGYHVPQMHIRTPDAGRFALHKGATTRDQYNRKVPLTEKKLNALLTQLNPSADGNVRALFSRAVPGIPIGPFSYRGFRPADPNDRIPHERRRSLRALWFFSAWLNNPDTRDANSVDTFVPVRGGHGYIKHYLIDFGDSLGATGNREKFASEGHEGFLEWSALLGRFLSLGLRYPYWRQVKRSRFRAVGIFGSATFDPGRWAPSFPNPAFDEATLEDSFWAATILARFTRSQIAAAVSAAKYSEPGAADYVVDVLVARQRKLLEHVFARMLPLGDFRGDGTTLRFKDLGVSKDETRRIRYSVRWNRTRRGDHDLESAVASGHSIDLSAALARARRQSGFARDPFLTVEFAGAGPQAGVAVHLRAIKSGLLVVGIDRSP